MQIPDLDYLGAFSIYRAMRDILHPPVPFWWAGGSLIAKLRGADTPDNPWNVADCDIAVRDVDYTAMCEHLRSKFSAAVCLSESAGDGATMPSRIGQGPSSVWKVMVGLPKLDIMALPTALRLDPFDPFAGPANAEPAAPVDVWIDMMDLNVCQVVVGPGVDGICLHADGSTLRDIAAGRVEILRHHPTTEARAEKYRRRLGGV